jgi:hypothetical protein
MRFYSQFTQRDRFSRRSFTKVSSPHQRGGFKDHFPFIPLFLSFIILRTLRTSRTISRTG